VEALPCLAALSEEIFSCFLQSEYPDALYLYERRLHIAKLKCMRVLTPDLYPLYESLLDCAQLRSRIGDHHTFGACAQELRAIATDLSKALTDPKFNRAQLETSINQLEDSYHNVLQIAARDPVVFLLFINSLKNIYAELSPGVIAGSIATKPSTSNHLGFISTYFSKVIFSVNLPAAFRAGIIPLLKVLVASSHNLNAISVANLLQALQDQYPEWVYSRGFNRGLRASWRFFLIRLERIVELFLSMAYLATRQIDPILLQDLNGRITDSMQKNQELLEILLSYFEKDESKTTHSNYTDDIKELEQALQRLLPPNLELLDISPDYVTLTALVRNLKDLRTLLLQLVKSL
jgi:hypothetical protein